MKRRLSTITIALSTILIVGFSFSLLTHDGAPTVGMYWPLLGTLPLLMFGLWGYFLPDPQVQRATQWVAPVAGWYELAGSDDSHRQRMIYATSTAWNLVTGFVIAHYWRCGEAPIDPLTQVVFTGGWILDGVGGLVLAVIGLNRWHMAMKRPVNHMHVESSKFPLTLGRQAKLRVEAEFAKGTRPMIVRVGVSCVRMSAQYVLGTPIYVSRKIYSQQWADVVMNQTIAVGERLMLDREFRIPDDAPPSSAKDKQQSPWFVWEVAIVVTFADARQYRQRYVIPAEQTTTEAKPHPRRTLRAAVSTAG